VRHNVGSEPTLYYFKNTWRIDHGMRNLSTTISRLITTFVGRELRDYMNKRDQSDLYKVMLSEVVRLNYMTGLRNKTVKALADLLTEEVQFDQDPDILGCSNVVIQYAEKEAFARPGRPEDLISMSTHLHYQKYTEEECAEVKTLFRKLFSDEELRAWFMRLMYSIPFGSNPERAYYVLFGCARNGKSGLLNMLELVLGDYFGRFSSKAFNERKDPSSTSPEIATMVGKRAMVSSELKAGAEMEADILKALTGDDGVPYRALYKNPGVLRMMAKILIASNHFPVFLNADKALRDRTVLIPMEAVFDTRGAPTDELEQYRTGHFPADQHYRQTLQRLAPKMLSMMVEGFAEYRMIGLEPKPQKVRDLCEAYWHEVGVQSRFISDCLEFIDAVSTTVIDVVSILPAPPAPTGRPKLTYTAAYDRFVAWALARQMDVSKYPRFTFKSLMDSELAAMREHKIDFTVDGWVGCRLRA
jgi:phage/plasmid-associated DNA primase